jgi:hypothetical protein
LVCEWDEPAAWRRLALADFSHWQTGHIADEGFSQLTDFGMIGRKSCQGTTVALNDELIVVLFHFSKTPQQIEGSDRVLKPSGDRTVGGRIATCQMAATRAQEDFNLMWRKARLKLT